ncbi:MAG: amino acid ABC transporter ATP-binding protein, partial [Lachnospiraceae bacterium]|nr:amino acid ABC transporter ATP-binding protein [Lachnospiraceae bacterium]
HRPAPRDLTGAVPQAQLLPTLVSSGSVKTTLLRSRNFLETPDGGTIRVRGETIFDASDPTRLTDAEIRRRRLHFGLVFQSFNLFPQYTALGNVILAKELLAKEEPDYRVRKAQIHREAEEQGRTLLTQMGLADRMDNYPHQLSGGQCQRVAIARALALQPDILCFDEPTSALDPELTGEVLRVIRELADHNTTMIIVTHEMAFARDVASQVIFMDDGRILEAGDPRQVLEHPREERTRQFLSRFSQG